MTRPVLLDLFCGAGGAAMGYHRAGFDVVGVDIHPQPRYPYEFHQEDAIRVLDHLVRHWGGKVAAHAFNHRFDAIHASPPCQDHSNMPIPVKHGTGWMLGATRERLQPLSPPWVIENVPGAPMRADFDLCGCMFGLGAGDRGLRRPRWFETSWHALDLRQPHHHVGRAISVAGHGAQGSWEYVDGAAPTQADRRAAMGIDWMNRNELGQAIPPAFTEHVGRALMELLQQPQAGAA